MTASRAEADKVLDKLIADLGRMSEEAQAERFDSAPAVRARRDSIARAFIAMNAARQWDRFWACVLARTVALIWLLYVAVALWCVWLAAHLLAPWVVCALIFLAPALRWL